MHRRASLLGNRIEGRDIRLAIRHPQALEHILGMLEAKSTSTGIVEPGRSWRLSIRQIDGQCDAGAPDDRSAAVSAEKMRVDFVANASHELRTPLSTVLGYAETLADQSDLPPESARNFGSTIRDEARRMLRIIEDLMSLSRIEADRFVVPGEPFQIAEIIGRLSPVPGWCAARPDANSSSICRRICRRSAATRPARPAIRQFVDQCRPLWLRQAGFELRVSAERSMAGSRSPSPTADPASRASICRA